MSVIRNTWSGAKGSTMTTMDGTLYDAADTDFNSLQPGLMGVLSFKTAAAAGTYGKLIPSGHKIQVINVFGHKVGAGGGAATATLKKNATAITDAIDVNKADKTVVFPTTIDTANNVLDGDAGDTLNLVTVTAADAAAEFHVLVKRVS